MVALAGALYVWGQPLLAVHRTRAARLHRVGAGLEHRHRLSTPADRGVVAPNQDTLYSSGWFDLRDGELIVAVDPIDPARYWSVMLIDAHTHVAYVSRRLHGSGGTSVRVVLDPGRAPVVDAPVDVLRLPTPTLWVLVRVLVDGPDDLAAARAVRRRIRVSQAGRPGGGVTGTAPVDVWGAGTAEGRATRTFQRLGAALALDPPGAWQPPLPDGGAELLADPPPEAVLAAGVEAGEAALSGHGLGADRHRDGWATRSRGADFGDDTTYRAAFARTSLAGHLPAENRSYSRAHDGSQAARLRFPPGSPPVDGFWSLTLYGPDLFLVDNPLDCHAVGDRTPGVVRSDGSSVVTVAAEPPEDASAWLPSPDGPCVLALRAYEGEPDVVDATWFPPALEPVAP